MESEYHYESETPKEVGEQPTPAAPTLSTRGQMNMSAPLPPEPAEIPAPPVVADQPANPPVPETPPAPIVKAQTPPVVSDQPASPPALETPSAPVAEAHIPLAVTDQPAPAIPSADKQDPPTQTVETQEQSEEIPLPRPDNPETKEVSGSKEATPGRDGGRTPPANDPVDDPTAAGHRRIQEMLKPMDASSQPGAPTPQPQTTDDPAVAPSSDAALPPSNTSLPVDDSTLPPVSPPLPTEPSNPLSNPSPLIPPSPLGNQSADTPIVFKTDYSTANLGGAANDLNSENRDINKANRELFEARAEAKRIEAETGLSIDEYRKQAAFRLAHPEFYDSSDPQEILNSSIPVSPPLPTTINTIASPVNLSTPSGDTVVSNTPLSEDSTTSLPPVLSENNMVILPVSPSLPTEDITSQPINTDTTNLETLPDGRLAVISGNPEMKKQFTHLQGKNSLGYQGTCGIVSCEDVAKQQGLDTTEDSLVKLASEKNLCVNNSLDPGELGGTTDANRADLLNKIGVTNEIISASNLEELAGYIENDQSAIAAVNAGALWNDANYLRNGFANHAIVVTGVARDPQSGRILGFFINDSGTGETGKFISESRFANAWLKRGGRLNITLPRK